MSNCGWMMICGHIDVAEPSIVDTDEASENGKRLLKNWGVMTNRLRVMCRACHRHCWNSCAAQW